MNFFFAFIKRMNVFKYLSGLALSKAGQLDTVYMGCTPDGLGCIKLSMKKKSLGLEVFARTEFEYRRSDMPEDPLFFLFPAVPFNADNGRLWLDQKAAQGSLYHLGSGETELLRSADDMLSILRSDMSLNRNLSGKISKSTISLMGIVLEERTAFDWLGVLKKVGVDLSEANLEFFRKLAASSSIAVTGKFCRAKPLERNEVFFGCDDSACARIEITGRQTARIERLEGNALLFFPSVKLALDEETGTLSAISRETPGLIYGLKSGNGELMTAADSTGYVCRQSIDMFGLRLNKARKPVDWVSVLLEKEVELTKANLGFLKLGFSHALKKLTEKDLADAECKFKQVALGTYFGCGGYEESCFEIEVVSDSEMTLTGVYSEGMNFGTNRWLAYFPRLSFSYHRCLIRVFDDGETNPGFLYNLVSNKASKIASLNALKNTADKRARTPLEFVYRGNAIQQRQLGSDVGFELKALERRQLWLDTARRRGWKLSRESERFLIQPMLNVFYDVYDAELPPVRACASSRVAIGKYRGFLTPDWKITMEIVSDKKVNIRVRSLIADLSFAHSMIDFRFDGSTCELKFPSRDFARNFKLDMKADKMLYNKANNFELTAIYSNMQTLTFMNSLLVFVPQPRAE